MRAVHSIAAEGRSHIDIRQGDGTLHFVHLARRHRVELLTANQPILRQGNSEKFLNDPTGTRRWLAFKVENIESPRTLPFEYEGIYSQAYYLYRNGFEYWFSGDETAAIDERNSRFKVANLERQLVYRYYSHPAGTDTGEFVDVATAMQQMAGNMTQKLKKEAVDQAFIDLGFEATVIDGMPGYLAVRRMPKEIDALGRQMAVRV